MTNAPLNTENEYVKIYTEEGIIVGEIKKKVFVDLSGAKKIVEDRKKITKNQESLILLDATEVKGISKEARDYFGSMEGSVLIKASAIYTNSKLSSFLANFLMKVNLVNTNVPVKLFTDRKKAIKWLHTYK
ncbi:MAG: hypothetical protein ACK5B9_05485 [Flavobacteriia bacterium]|jgi:hypothetical protein